LIFFTDEKYQNDTAWIEYEKYIRSIWKDLPYDLRMIHEGMLPEELFDKAKSVSLHDARITNYYFDKKLSVLSVVLNTDYEGNLRKAFFEYYGAKIIQDVSPNRKGLGLDDYHSDIMCHELTKDEEDNFQHAIIFCSGEEFILRFSCFKMKYEDI